VSLAAIWVSIAAAWDGAAAAWHVTGTGVVDVD
jgi:hypothetical protein